jgi:hypothetical protein
VRVPGAFYRRTLRLLQDSGIPFLVGGGYAFGRHTGIDRHTVDLDVFVVPEDAPRVLEIFSERGFMARMVFSHWLGKIYDHGRYVDVIFSSGNGVARVDSDWFRHARRGRVFEVPVRLCPAEEMIWSKAFVMERERFDGADIMHLIRAHGDRLDWNRLLRRFGPHWRVLTAYLILYGYAYPSERERVPRRIMQHLLRRLEDERDEPDHPPVCMGTLLSRVQFLPDLTWGYRDGRLVTGAMTRAQIQRWTKAAHMNGAVPDE